MRRRQRQVSTHARSAARCELPGRKALRRRAASPRTAHARGAYERALSTHAQDPARREQSQSAFGARRDRIWRGAARAATSGRVWVKLPRRLALRDARARPMRPPVPVGSDAMASTTHRHQTRDTGEPRGSAPYSSWPSGSGPPPPPVRGREAKPPSKPSPNRNPFSHPNKYLLTRLRQKYHQKNDKKLYKQQQNILRRPQNKCHKCEWSCTSTKKTALRMHMRNSH